MSFSMPMVGLGTWLISNDEVSRVVTDALNLGYKHIDTAQVYQNESGIGEAISKPVSYTHLTLPTILLV